MVNANVVISVSAVLVALILTLVIVMRQDGDPEDNFSVSVAGNYVVSGTTYQTAMYYCTGDSCRFYDALSATDDFPGYFALVGFSGSDGNTYVTEHSIGKTFIFDGAGALTECRPVDHLNTDELAAKVANLADSWNAESKSFDSEGRTYTLTSYAMDTDPSDDEPKVLGFTVPTVAQCDVANGITKDVVDTTPRADGAAPPSRKLGEEQGERHLALDGQSWANWASYGYDGGAPPNGFIHYTDCIHAGAVGRIAYSGATKIVAFAGTNDFQDVVQDMTTWGHAIYHGGFWEYVGQLTSCLNGAGGNTATYIVGHSLGGAAATIYAQNYATSAKVVTFGAPKTTKTKACSSTGIRFFNEVDPVASNGMGIMGDFKHDVGDAKKLYFQSGACKSRDWWRFCVGHYPGVYGVVTASCGEEATGCSWLVDCLYNVGAHSLDFYRKYQIGTVSY